MNNRYEVTKWDLSELLVEPSESEIARRVEELDRQVTSFEGIREELDGGISSDRLAGILADYESLVEAVQVLGAYAGLWFASDTQSSDALTFRNRIEQLLTQVQNRILFFDLWWKGLSDEEAAALQPKGPEHDDWRHFLRDLRRLRPFTLDEKSEQIVNLKDADGIGAVLTLYSMLTNRLEFSFEIDGESQTVTRDELMANVFSPVPERREATYRELYRVYGREAQILGQIYANRVRDWQNENVGLRSFESPIAVRNVANDLPDRAVEVLLDVVSEHAPLFQKYFRLKAGWLGMERLRRYDLYAPLGAADRTIPYAEATEMVLSTFGGFDSKIAERAERVFSDRHIDSEIRKGKKGGAFCATVLPHQTPWVLVNYTGRVRDVATLAHELGHAVHSMLASEHSVLTQHPSLPLAETASVFSEMLVTDRLLAEVSDPVARRELLASAVDDIYATVLRQTYFVRFERAAHEAILAGKSSEELNELYFGTLTEQFGDAVEVSPEFRYEWVSIPHIYHTPFYCYAYSFGQLLVLALYRRYKDEGDAFIPGYLRLLAHGGSARPQEILAEAGVDPTDPDFWRGGFEVVADMIDELSSL